MRKRPAYYVFLGLLGGGIIGFGVGALNGNPIHGLQLGALTGIFIGWILTAPALQG
jgi:hypothetical protein